MTDPICPECINGKHINCTRLVLADECTIGSGGTVIDVMKPCVCPVCEGGRSGQEG